MDNQISNNAMMNLTQNLSMKQININGKPYLQRYFAGETQLGDVWIHRFLSQDTEPHLHNHGFEFITYPLRGGYTEQYMVNDEIKTRKSIRTDDAQDVAWRVSNPEYFQFATGRHVSVFDWHRIVEVEEHTWTGLLVYKKRLPLWFFKDEEGRLKHETSSPIDWWKNYKVRPDSGIAVDDNRFKVSRT